MSLSTETHKKLTDVVTSGAKACAARMSEVTHHPWRVDAVVLSLDDAGPFADMLASVTSDHYGSHLAFPGGSFLVLFSGKSGYLVSSAFTRDVQDRLDGMPKREAHTLGEAANILLNPLIGHLADVWDVSLIISAPKTGISSQRDHLSKALSRYKEGERLAATFFVKLVSPQLFSECLLLLFLDQGLIDKITGAPGP